jgi:transcriptional adapter 2-alpha
MQAAEKKRPREDKEFIQRLRPFARLQTAEDFEIFATDMLCTVFTSDRAHIY